MISLAQFDTETASLMVWMERIGTPGDVQQKVCMALERMRARLWPEAQRVQ